ncbi:MAG: HlyD family efflux transporter periplasmic adaptor subunit [Propionicimonas sp.]
MKRHGIAGLALALTLGGCSAAPSGLVVSGTVRDRLETVVVPAVSVPMVNLDAGFTTLTGATNPVTGRTGPNLSSVGSTYGFGTFVRLAEITVAVGDTVTAGQSLGRIDTSVLVAQVAAAKADAAVAAAQVGLLGDAIDTTYDKQADIKDAKAKVLDAISKIHDGQGKLGKARSSAKKIRADLVKQLHAMENLLAHYPAATPPPPGLPPKEALPGVIAKLKAGIAKLDAGVRKINSVLHTLATGLKKATSGLRKLDDAIAKITEARGSLRDLQELAALQADALTVPISLARAQVTLAELTSPVDGTVVSVATAGSVLAPGARAVSIRETRASTVTAWLAPEELTRVCSGDPATILGDWMTNGVDATLTRIGTRSDYPPTSVATEEIHLTRAVEVEFTATEQLPAGVPVELTINSCHPAAGKTDTDR